MFVPSCSVFTQTIALRQTEVDYYNNFAMSNEMIGAIFDHLLRPCVFRSAHEWHSVSAATAATEDPGAGASRAAGTGYVHAAQAAHSAHCAH